MSNKSVEEKAKSENAIVEKKPSPAPTEKAKPAKKKTSVKKKPSHIAFMAIMFALSAVSLAAYNFWMLNKQQVLNKELGETQQDLQSRIIQLGQQLQAEKSALQKEVRARESAQAEHQALSTAMQNVSEKLGRSTVAWRMAEVEYLLTVANHRLTLARDRETAISIFETADERIKAIGDPSLLKVRKAIADELLALRAIPKVDISGLAFRVGSLVKSVEQLPLLDKKRIAVALKTKSDKKPENWEQLPLAVWNDLKSLVQVRRHQQPTEPLLPPDETRHLYQNLRLKLEQARLSVLRRDTALFHQHITEAKNWLKHYFETESADVVSAVASLDKMLTIELQPAIPNVNQSLRILREVMANSQAVVK